MPNDLFQPIEPHVASDPTRLAVVTPDGQKLTHQQLAHTVEAFTCKVKDKGIGHGDHVAINIPNHAVQLCLMLALSRIGAVNMIGNSTNGYLKSGVRVDYEISTEMRLGTNPVPIIFTQDWFLGEVEAPSEAPSGGEFSGYSNKDAPALICATSGTTGHRKHLCLSYATLMARIPCYGQLLGYQPESLMLTMLLDSLVGFSQALRILHGGGLFMRPGGSPEATLELIREHEIEELFATPNVLSDLISAQKNSPVDMPALKHLVIAGSAMSPTLAEQASRLLCPDIHVLYGATETGPLVHGHFGETGKTVLGKLAPWVSMQALDDDGNVLGPDESGSIRVNVPEILMIDEYLATDNPTDRTSLDGEWFYPGDWGVVSEGGEFSLSGRLDDRINVGGNKFAASDVEAIALNHKTVKAAAATGVENEAGFQDICVAVTGDIEINVQLVKQALHDKFGKTSPIRVIQVEALPLNAAGKLDRPALRELF